MIVASLNICCGISAQLGRPKERCVDYLANFIRQHRFDVLFLQEIPVAADSTVITSKDIAQHTPLTHWDECALSQSHLLDNTMMGLAILSRRPIRFVRFIPIRAPEMKRCRDGKIEYAHQKGFLECEHIESRICLVNGHCPSFSYFNEDEINYKEQVYAPLEREFLNMAKHKARLVIGGDFNTNKILDVLPGMAKKYEIPILNTPTRPGGKQSDYFFIRGLDVQYAQVVETVFDHYCCITEINT